MSGRPAVGFPAPREAWLAALSEDRDALLTQTPEWVDMICAVDGWRDASRIYSWPSGRRLVLPMVSKGIGGRDAVAQSLPPGWGFGGLIGPDITASEVLAVREDLSGLRLLHLRVCPNPLQGPAWIEATRGADRTSLAIPRRAHALDLAGGPTQIWKRFSDNVRRAIRKAERQALDVECDTTGRLLDVFHDLWLLSTRRWAAQQGQPCWLLRARLSHLNPPGRWRQIAQRVAGGTAIWVARQGGEPIASIIVLRGANDHYTRGAMNKELAGRTGANHLLHWLAIQDACRRGANWYQMGQSSLEDGSVARFKESLRAKPYIFPEFTSEFLPISRLKLGTMSALRTVYHAGLMRPVRG